MGQEGRGLFHIRKMIPSDSAESLDSSGHFLSVVGQRCAVVGQKPLAILTVNSQSVVRERTKTRGKNGRKQPKGQIRDS
jgi:hypothetical protein